MNNLETRATLDRKHETKKNKRRRKKMSGVYKIYPKNTSGFEAYCEMEKNGGGWTVSDAILFVAMIG
jgi:hypothetical protein